jgi:hypothetical protein
MSPGTTDTKEETVAEKQPVAEALRSELLKLAKDGDQKKEGALTPEVLMRIMRVAKTGRDVLVSLDASPSNLAGMVRRPNGPAWYSPVAAYGDDMGDESSDGATGGGMLATPFSPSPPGENFGMTAIRELISAAKNLNGNGTSPAKLVEALAIAREKGLHDVAKDLESQLGMKKESPPMPATPVPEPVGAEKGGTQS